MTDNTPRPLTVRGVRYPSRRAAARALGVEPVTLKLATIRGGGALDRVGLKPCPAAMKAPAPVTLTLPPPWECHPDD